jgi:glycosyltransferase involved in cell wall biosynthesis
MEQAKRLLFYSRYSFFPQLYAVFQTLCSEYGIQGFIITHERTAVPKVYSPSGYLSHESAGLNTLPDFVTVIPQDLSVAEKTAILKSKVDEIRPDFIWVHEEPSDFFVNQMLQWFHKRRIPRIVVYLAENIWPIAGGNRERWAKFRRRRLWRRYDGVLACATKSAEAIRAYGMPETVPISIAWTPNLPPPAPGQRADDSFLPSKQSAEFFIGFAGRITAAKGWRVLLAALTQLPEHCKCLIAGDGDEEAELRLWCQMPALRERVYYFGALEKAKLWDFYRALDVFVLPSLTTPRWAEQFGFVLAEAMACGVPVIGSDSGAIPEVIGDSGIIVEENNSTALAAAIRSIENDPHRRARYIHCGQERFEQEFSIAAYARKLAALLGLGTMPT